MEFRDGGLAVLENFRQVIGPRVARASWRVIFIAHYMTRSQVEYSQRVHKYTQGMSGWVNKSEALLGWADGVATAKCNMGANLSKHIETRLLVHHTLRPAGTI